MTEVYSRYQAPQLTDEQVRDLNARARIRIAAENAEKNRKKQEKKLAKANKKGKADLVAHRFGESNSPASTNLVIRSAC